MSYLEAKNVLLEKVPQVSIKLIVIEAAAMICVAGILVRLFA